MKLFRKIVEAYGKLNIQKKLSFIVITAVMIPMVLTLVIFSGRLFNMITSDTIRQEQNSASRTAPLVEDMVADILSGPVFSFRHPPVSADGQSGQRRQPLLYNKRA